MTIYYEWDVETTTAVESERYEKGEVLDHNHFDTYAEALAFSKTDCEEGCEYVIVLVRDDDFLSPRAWAYMENGKLPTHFEDAHGRMRGNVPMKYHREVQANS